MSGVLLLLVVSSAVANEGDRSSTSIMDNLQKLRQVVLNKLTGDSARTSKDLTQKDEGSIRMGKSYGYYPYVPLNFPSQDIGYFFPQGKTPLNQQEWRTEPFKRKTSQPLLDSPIYYVRLPASPYVFIPGVGYVSRPPSLNEPDILNSLSENKPDTTQNGELLPSNFIRVPIDFVSNGKPTSVYQLLNDPMPKPKPDGLLSLDKGPYIFNGKPNELFILRNSYNRIYADALTNFYP